MSQGAKYQCNSKRSICYIVKSHLVRGVARNLLTGTKQGVWRTEVPSGVQRQNPGGGLELETYTKCITVFLTEKITKLQHKEN